jgi:hypothetical protein
VKCLSSIPIPQTTRSIPLPGHQCYQFFSILPKTSYTCIRKYMHIIKYSLSFSLSPPTQMTAYNILNSASCPFIFYLLVFLGHHSISAYQMLLHSILHILLIASPIHSGFSENFQVLTSVLLLPGSLL